MSIKSFLLLVLLLGLCLHACCVRNLGPPNNRKLEKKSYASSNNKNDDEKKGFHYKISASSKMDTFTSNDDEEVKATKGGDNNYSTSHEETMKCLYNSKANQKLLEDQDDKKTSCLSSKASSALWPVPHQRSRDKLPGFNEDYSPPKTHPPSHN